MMAGSSWDRFFWLEMYVTLLGDYKCWCAIVNSLCHRGFLFFFPELIVLRHRVRDRDDEMYKHKMRNNGAKYARLVVVGTLTPDPAAEKEKKVSPPTHPSREYWGDDTYRTEEGSTVASAFVPYRGVEVWERRRADCSADAQTARPTLVGRRMAGWGFGIICVYRNHRRRPHCAEAN